MASSGRILYKAWVLRKYFVLAFVAGGILVADQATKFWVIGELTTRFDGLDTFGEKVEALYSKAPAPGLDGYHHRAKRVITLSENFLHLRYAENPGGAWGIFRGLSEGLRSPLFHLVNWVAVIFIGYYFRKLSGTNPDERWVLWGLPAVLGGALGNYSDRVARGFVIDFVEAHWFDKVAWPSFNVADSAISIGVCMLLIDGFIRDRVKRETALASPQGKDSSSPAAGEDASPGKT